MYSLLHWMNTIKISFSNIRQSYINVLDKVPLHKYLQSQSKPCCNDNTFKVYNIPIVLTLTLIMDKVPLHKFFNFQARTQKIKGTKRKNSDYLNIKCNCTTRFDEYIFIEYYVELFPK